MTPPPAPPPPDTRTPEELEALAREFLADGSGETPAGVTSTEAISAEDESQGLETVTDTALESQAEDTEAADTLESESTASEASGPEWLRNALKGVPEGTLPSWLPDRLLKMAAKDAEKTATIKRLQETLGQAQESVPVVVEATVQDVLANVSTEEALQQVTTQAKATKELAERWIEWLQDNREGGEVTPGDPDSYLDAEGVKAKLALARQHLRQSNAALEAAPAKQAWLKEYHSTRSSVLKDVPALADKGSEEHKYAMELLQKPLAARADMLQIVADALAGRQMRLDKANGVQTVTLKPKPKAGAAPAQNLPRAAAPVGAGATTAAPVRPAGAPPDFAGLRQRALAGDESASNALARSFLEG